MKVENTGKDKIKCLGFIPKVIQIVAMRVRTISCESSVLLVTFIFHLAIGPVPSPFDCYLVNRGMKTLHVRMLAHQKNGLAVANFLESNPRVEKVLHPGKALHLRTVVHARTFKDLSNWLL